MSSDGGGAVRGLEPACEGVGRHGAASCARRALVVIARNDRAAAAGVEAAIIAGLPPAP